MNDSWADRQREQERRRIWQLCAWVWDRRWHLLFLSVRVNDVCGFCCPLGSHMCNYSQTVTLTVNHLLHTALKNGETWLKLPFSLLRAAPGNETCWLIVTVSNQLHISHDSTLMHCQQSLKMYVYKLFCCSLSVNSCECLTLSISSTCVLLWSFQD